MTQSTSSNQQQSTSAPWAPTQQTLGSLIGNINSLPTAPTSAQQAALGQLQSSVSNLPNYGPTAANTANSFLGGDPTGLLGSSYNTLQQQLNPIANQNPNPTSNPIIQSLLGNINQQVTTATNANAAAAGRSLNSGDNAGATAFNLASAELPTLLGQYNTNQQNIMNAGNSLFTGGQNTANSMTGNTLQGLNISSAIPAYYAQNANAQLGAANTAQQLPFQNIGAAENLTIPIAGLGGQTQGTSNTQGTPSILSDITSSLQGLGSLAGGAGLLFGGTTPAINNILGGVKGVGNGILGAFGGS